MHARFPNEEVFTPSTDTQPDPLLTNGFEVALPQEVEVIVRELPDPSHVRPEREKLSGFWFVHWFDGKLFHLRLKAGGPNVEGALTVLNTAEHPWLLRARLEDALEAALPRYAAVKKRPFTFLAQKAELIKVAAEEAGVSHKCK